MGTKLGTPPRLLGLVALLALSVSAWADYTIITTDGQRFAAVSRYVINENDMVQFKLTSGPEISLTREHIDWVATANANNEKPPTWAKPIKRRRAPGENQFKMPAMKFDWRATLDDISRLAQRGLRWDTIRQFQAGSWVAVLGGGLILCLIYAFVLWFSLNAVGEPLPIFKVVRWHFVIVLASLVLQTAISYIPVSFWYILILDLVVNYFLIAIIVIHVFECDIPSGMLGTLGYFTFVAITMVGAWRAVI